MQDTELYEKLLGIESPWSVERVALDVEAGRVDIWVQHPAHHRWSCPDCEESSLACRDHAPERTWRHLDSCQFQTYLHARIPRVKCPEHGVRQTSVPWAEARSRFTLLMERWIIDVLLQCATVQGACRLLGLKWDAVWGVLRRSVERGRDRKEAKVVARYGVDEKAFKRGHNYMTVVCDMEEGTVEHVVEDRTTASLEGFWKSLTPEQFQLLLSDLETLLSSLPQNRYSLGKIRFLGEYDHGQSNYSTRPDNSNHSNLSTTCAIS